MAASRKKTSLGYILIAVLSLCVVLPQVSANRRAETRIRAKRQDCKDNGNVQRTCEKLVKELGLGVCYTEIEQLKAKLNRSCAATCHFCGKPQGDCRFSSFGCCWDRRTPRKDVYGIKGCPDCKDHLKLCKRFKKFCFGKKTENREFIELHCPKTCNKCIERKHVKVGGQKIKMSDWFRV